MTTTRKTPLVGLVGPCSSGKSTLQNKLEERGIRVRHIAQEHSYVKDMWRRLSNPDILIYLHVSYAVAQSRRKLNWEIEEYEKQLRRLRHAREHADLYLDTDSLTPEEALEKALNFIQEVSG